MQLVKTDLLSGGDNLTLSFLPGDHVLTEQLLICNFSHVQITGQNKSTTIVRFHSNGTILFFSISKLSIERLGFIIGANVGLQNSHQGLTIDNAHEIYINFMDFELLNQVEEHSLYEQHWSGTYYQQHSYRGIFLRESALFVNEPIEIYHNTADKDGGGIYEYLATA